MRFRSEWSLIWESQETVFPCTTYTDFLIIALVHKVAPCYNICSSCTKWHLTYVVAVMSNAGVNRIEMLLSKSLFGAVINDTPRWRDVPKVELMSTHYKLWASHPITNTLKAFWWETECCDLLRSSSDLECIPKCTLKRSVSEDKTF